MTLTIDLPANVEERLRQAAADVGVDVSEYAKQVLENHLRPPSPPPAAAANERTLALLARWDAEDATDDPAELDARRRDWEEFKRGINEGRSSSRLIYPD